MGSLDESVFRSRLQAVEAALRQAGHEALLVYANGSALGPASRSHGYMTYLCGWDSHNAPSILLVRPGREPVLVVPHVFLARLAKETMWLDARFCLPGTLGTAVAGLLSEGAGRNGGSGSYAVLGRGEAPIAIWEQLTARLANARFTDFAAAIDPLRLIKTDLQVAMHQRAADLCDELFALLGPAVRAGKPTHRIQADLEHHARGAGAEFFQSWLTVMPIADYCRTYREECLRVPQPGDQVLLGLYVMLEGHWGHALRSGVVGTPSQAQRDVYAVACEMFEQGLAALAPGRDLREVEAAAQAAFEHRYPDATKRAEIFRFRTGHALGLSYEDPIATAAFPQPYDDDFGAQASGADLPALPAQPGILLELHPNLFVPGVGGAALGDMVLVTQRGYRLLTSFARELLVF
jgi:Xaa-Pro dipeptidase